MTEGTLGTVSDDLRPVRVRRVDARRNLDAIVQAAARMLAEDPRVSMQEIAVSAGLHRATVHRHFPSRDDLVQAVLEHAYDESDRALEAILADGSRSSREQLERFVDAMLEIGDRWRTWRYTGITPEVQRRNQALGSPLTVLVGKAQQDGTIRTDLPADLVAVALGGLVHGSLTRMAGGSLTREQAVAFTLQVLSPPA